MGFQTLFKTGKWSAPEQVEQESKVPQAPIEKHTSPSAYITSQTFSVPYDGEKNIGEVGPVKVYTPIYQTLRNRCWQLFLDSDRTQTVIRRHLVWNVKNGLRLQFAPKKDVLSSFGINVNLEPKIRQVEDMFELWSNDKLSSHNKENTFNQLQEVFIKDSIVGGDVLNIMRFQNGRVTFQCIDGAHMKANTIISKLPNGNWMRDSIEYNDQGEHVAYHVNASGKNVRVEAYDPVTGLRQAWLHFGSRYRIDNMRGIPIIATAIELIAKTDRYKQATVEQAEEIKKLAYAFTHNVNATGENPMAETMGYMSGNNQMSDDEVLKSFDSGEGMARHVSATTGRNALNLYPGSDVKSLESKNELYFKDFEEALSNQVASLVNMPPNVAWSTYNDSFSASRAATKDFGNTMDYNRKDYDAQSLNYVFMYWLYWECWSGRIQLPGFISSFERKDMDQRSNYICLAYSMHRFIGNDFPHIDPVKEVEAARKKLGPAFDNVPLSNVQDETENLMGGDSDQNMERAQRDLEKAKSLGLIDESNIED